MRTDAPAGPNAGLLAILGVGFGVAVTVGNTIGSGILRTPGEIAALLPGVLPFFSIWLAGGLYALMGGNALAELAAMTPESGGYTVFVRRALGPFAGFVVGWSDWLSTCSSTAAGAIVVGEYTAALLGAGAATRLYIGAGAVLFFTAVQWRGTRTAGAAQEVTAALKALAFVLLIGACFAFGGDEAVAVVSTTAIPPAWPIAVVLALQAVIFTYDGYAGVVYFAGEVRDPGRDIPRSIFGGLAVVIAIYLLLNAAILYVVPLGAIADAELAAGVATEAIFGTRGGDVLRVIVILSLLSGINAWQLMAARIGYGLGAVIRVPAMRRVNPRGTPTTALVLSTIIVLSFLLSGTFEQVIAITAFFFVANYTLSFISLFMLRRNEPDAPRPFRAIGHPWSTGIVLAGSLAFVVATIIADRRSSIIALLLLAVSYPIYRGLRRAAD